MTDTVKVCRKCGDAKPLDGFGRDASRPDGRHAYCLLCRRATAKQRYESDPTVKAGQRWRSIRHRYGLTREAFEALWEQQDGRCAICRDVIAQDPGTRLNAATDHCHDTGRVRGLLCQPCNRGLGHFRDSPELLRAALTYLGHDSLLV